MTKAFLKEISIELSTYAKHIYICSRNVQKLEIVHDKIIENKDKGASNIFRLNKLSFILNLPELYPNLFSSDTGSITI